MAVAFRLRPLLPLVAGLAILLAAVIGSVFLSAQQRHAADRVRHTVEVEAQLNAIQSLAADAETGQRGYLLTGRGIYLQPYRAAVSALDGELSKLSALIRDNPAQQSAVERLRRLIASKVAELGHTVALRARGRSDAALAIVNSDSGNRMMIEIRGVIAGMRSEERRQLADRSAAAIRSTWTAQAGLIASAVLIVLVGWSILRDARSRLLALSTSNHRLLREATEREAAEDQVRQLQKMEAVGQLTGGIAHDFNNMLAIIIGSLDIARRRLTGNEHPKVVSCIDNAMQGAERAAVLTARLLAFSRQQPLEPRVVDANKLVSGMSELLRRTIGEPIKIETVLAGGLWRTHADPTQIENAVLNLAVNARDAMPNGGRLTIETCNADLDDRYAREHTEVTAGQYVLVSVSDTGVGMPAEVIARAFEPFYTTKGVGKGTGLGLSQVFGFVKQSHGHIKIYSEIGKGTTIKIYLPRYVGDDDSVASTEQRPAAPVGSLEEIILVVEDEAQVRHMSVDALRELGYTVLQAATPFEALQQLQIAPNVALMFTDIVMPEMTGRQLADRAIAAKPTLKVLYTTGYTRNAVVHGGVLDRGTAFIAKPFSIEQLALKVREVLQAS